MSKFIIAVDPGAKGGICHKYLGDIPVHVCWPYPGTKDDPGVAMYKYLSYVAEISKATTLIAYVEAVSGYIGEKQPGSRMFNFGQTVGEQVLACRLAGFNVVRVYPITWQKALKLKRDDEWTEVQWKNYLKSQAQEYLGYKPTLAVSDAALIYKYAVMKESYTKETLI